MYNELSQNQSVTIEALCLYIYVTYSVKTWFLEILSVSARKNRLNKSTNCVLKFLLSL